MKIINKHKIRIIIINNYINIKHFFVKLIIVIVLKSLKNNHKYHNQIEKIISFILKPYSYLLSY